MEYSKLEHYLSHKQYKLRNGIYFFETPKGHATKLNRINVLEELGKGRVWKNVYAHYFRLLFVMRWLKPNNILVDVGCGRGWLMDLIYRNQMKVSYIGTDLSQKSLEYASAKKFKYPRMLLRTNCIDLPLTTSFSDYVACLEIIEHNNKEDAENIIRNCHRILKKEGLFFLSTPIRKGSKMIFPNDHIYEWEFKEITEFLLQAGFEIQSVFGCFGKRDEIVDILDDPEKEVFLKFSDYFSWHVLAPFFSVLHPEDSQGAIWFCRKRNSGRAGVEGL